MLRLAREMGMTANELERRMTGRELVEHIAEQRLAAAERVKAQKRGI